MVSVNSVRNTKLHLVINSTARFQIVNPMNLSKKMVNVKTVQYTLPQLQIRKNARDRIHVKTEKRLTMMENVNYAPNLKLFLKRELLVFDLHVEIMKEFQKRVYVRHVKPSPELLITKRNAKSLHVVLERE